MCLSLISHPTNIYKRLADTALIPGKVLLCVTLGFILTACDGPTPDIVDLDNITLVTFIAETIEASQKTPTEPLATITSSPEPEVTPTITSSPQPSPTPSPEITPTLPAYNVTGRTCFPNNNIPPMTAYFEETETSLLVELPIVAEQTTYQIRLQPGTYIAYAWLDDFSQGGLYSRAVPCGLGDTCEDHGLLPFTVTREDVLTDIDICDWYAGPFNVPYPVGKAPDDVTGRITGSLTYITEITPGLRVVAFNLGTSYWYWVSTIAEQSTFSISGLPAGRYHVVAYDAESRAGGHTDADNNLIEVVVNAGETTAGVTIDNWSAPSEAFPPDPTRQ